MWFPRFWQLAPGKNCRNPPASTLSSTEFTKLSVSWLTSFLLKEADPCTVPSSCSHQLLAAFAKDAVAKISRFLFVWGPGPPPAPHLRHCTLLSLDFKRSFSEFEPGHPSLVSSPLTLHTFLPNSILAHLLFPRVFLFMLKIFSLIMTAINQRYAPSLVTIAILQWESPHWLRRMLPTNLLKANPRRKNPRNPFLVCENIWVWVCLI